MPVETVIAGGQVATATEINEQSIAIDGEEIVAVGDEGSLPEAETRIDATGKVVLPGVVDPHVHVDEVPANRAGTYESESAAAALGGVTTFIDFAWQGGDRALSDEDATLADGIANKRANADRSYVDFGLHGVLHRESSETFEEIGPAVDVGVTSFKMFMSTYEVGVPNGFVDEAFEHIADHDSVAVLHTEDPSICKHRTERLKREGKGDPEYYPDSRPDYAEAMAAEDAARMAVEADIKYYGIHTTCRKAAEILELFQEDGSQIRGETCTHYLTYTRDLHRKMGNLPLIAPPLRTADDVEAMFEHLERGTLDVVSTDHAVYHQEAKDEVGNWWDSPFGANGLQWSLPVLHEVVVNRRGYSYPFLVRVLSSNPARTFGLPRKGGLVLGTDADIVIFDPNETHVIDADENASNSTFSIYDGIEVSGKVDRTFVRGTQVVDDGELVIESGHGEFVERECPDWGH